jgi:hypothetical protein
MSLTLLKFETRQARERARERAADPREQKEERAAVSKTFALIQTRSRNHAKFMVDFMADVLRDIVKGGA